MKMYIAIIGSRNCQSLTIQNILPYLPKECTHIISGGAIGVDKLAKDVAKHLNLCYIELKPNYKKYGKKAPILRNKQIVERAEMVLAFWDSISAGTSFTIQYCLKKSIPVRVISLQEACSNAKFQL